jgi:DNA-damage-inducible protein J
MLHVRLDNELKAKATEALAAMGLSASDAVRLLFHRIAVDQAFLLELKVPNAETCAALAEVELTKAEQRARFADANEMFAALDGKAR